MAKTNVKTKKDVTTVTKEQEEFLASRRVAKTEETPKEDRVILPGISIKGEGFVLKDGDKTTNFPHFKMRVLDVYFKFMRRGTKADNFKPVAESIAVRHGERKAYIDTLGTTNCGKLPQYAVPKGWSEAQKEANNEKATFYAIVYGIVNDKLVKFQVPSAKAAHIMGFFKDLGVDDPAQVEMKVSLDDKGYLVTDVIADNHSVLEYMNEIQNIVTPDVERSNAWVESRYKRMRGENATAEAIFDDEETPF